MRGPTNGFLVEIYCPCLCTLHILLLIFRPCCPLLYILLSGSMAASRDYPSPSTLTSGLTLPSTCDPPGEENPPTQKTWIVGLARVSLLR